MIGRTVGKYRILDALGRGGMGTVYRAVDQTLDREVAIKVLNPELLETENLARFRAEAFTLAKLNHARIATLYEFVNEPDALLMVMEYVRGETLERMAGRTGPLPLPRAAHLSLQILDALKHAHSCGIVHRDLKPANLMVTLDGDVKVMDFGIARVSGTAHLTSGGFMMGTPAYMAPEQVRGLEVDARTDLYAVGIMLYRLVTGRLPFKVDTAVAMIQAQLNDPPTPIGQLRGDLPPWFEPMLARALDKTPAQRFQSAEEFRGAIMSGLQMTPLSASHAGTTAQFAPTMLPTPTPLQVATTVPQAKVRAPWQGASLLLGAAVLAAGGGAAGFFVMRASVREAPATAVAPVASATAATGTAVAPAAEAPVAVAPLTADAPPPGAAEVAPSTSASVVAPEASPVRPAVRPTRPASAITGSPRPAAPVDAAPAAALPPPLPAAPAPVVETMAARPEGAAMTFDDVRILVLEGSKSRETSGRLTIGGGAIAFTLNRQLEPAKTLPYGGLLSATYAQSRHPRWKEGLGVAVAAGVFSAPFFFMKSTRHWLTLQGSDDFMVLRLDKDNVNLILPAIESRTGLQVDRVKDAK